MLWDFGQDFIEIRVEMTMFYDVSSTFYFTDMLAETLNFSLHPLLLPALTY